LIPSVRSALLKLNRIGAAGDLAKKTLRALGSFVGAMKINYNDIEFGVDLGSEPGVADSGDLEHDLLDLFTELGRAAKEKHTAVVFFIDELQYVEEEELALAWLDSSINLTQLVMALGLQKGVANAYSKICIFLRSAYQSNKLKIL